MKFDGDEIVLSKIELLAIIGFSENGEIYGLGEEEFNGLLNRLQEHFAKRNDNSK